MPRKKVPKTIAVSVRLEPETYRRLKALSARSHRSLSWHISKTMEEAMEYLEEELAAVERGIEEFRQGKSVDAEQFLKKLLDKAKSGEEAVIARRAV
jgi:predicted transcriptional regulator